MTKSVRDFLNIILNGTALGVVAGLIPNAVLSTLFKYLGTLFAPGLFTTLTQAMYLLQFAIPVLVGVIVGQSLKFKPLESAVLGATVLAASGSFVFVLDDGVERKEVFLNRPNKALHIKQGIWREMKDFSGGSVCLVLASMEYKESDYIHNYDEFKRQYEK